MRHFLFFLMFFIVNIIDLNSQLCGVRSNIDINKLYNGSGTFNIRVYWHIVRNNAGVGVNSEQLVNDIITQTKNTFAGHGINLISTCYEEDIIEINNSILYNATAAEGPFCVFTELCKHDGLNVFLLDASSEHNAQGLAAAPGNICFAKVRALEDFSVVVHEIGHCFGLFHTDHGRSFLNDRVFDINAENIQDYSCELLNEEMYKYLTGNNWHTETSCEGTSEGTTRNRFIQWELVDGSNSDKAGDFVVDTPADIFIVDRCGHDDTNRERDCNIDDPNCPILNRNDAKDPKCTKYKPDYENFMGQKRHICRDHFTQGQVSRMKGVINQHLQYMVASNVNGPSLLTYYSNTCSKPIINLNELHIGQVPKDANLVFSTDSDPSNGVSPIINSITISGTYYAYYFYTIANCYSKVSNPINVEMYEIVSSDLLINIDSPLTGNKIIRGDIIINAGATLHLHTAQIKFEENKKIIIRNGGKLILQSANIGKCNDAYSWGGIIIEDGGFFDTDNSDLSECINGVSAYGNSIMQVNNLNISGVQGNNLLSTGIEINGNVDAQWVYNITITHFKTGIDIKNSTKSYAFNYGEIESTVGLKSNGSQVIIDNITFVCNTPIALSKAFASHILNCEFLLLDAGIQIFDSDYTIIELNQIYHVGNSNYPAIFLWLSDYCEIKDNPDIVNSKTGIALWACTNSLIEHNFIETIRINLDPLKYGGPISILGGSQNRIINNHIHGTYTEFGIYINSSANNIIENNDLVCLGLPIHNTRTGAIKLNASVGDEIKENILSSTNFLSGVMAQNTSGCIISCNNVETNLHGLDIYKNSENHSIKANNIHSSGESIFIRSEIGIQGEIDNGFIIKNNGNNFIGPIRSVRAEGLTINQVLGSIFPVNPLLPHHLPLNINPNNWFNPNPISAYENCQGVTIGTDWLMFRNNPDQICAYWQNLKTLQTSNPELFFIKLFHLLRYAKLKPNFILPDCIKNDPRYKAVCGIEKLVGISSALTTLGQKSVNTTPLQLLRDQYRNEPSNEGKLAIHQQIKAEMSVLLPQMEENMGRGVLKLDSLAKSLDSINCNSIIVTKWKDVLSKYIKFLKTGIVDEQDKSQLESYSMECSDKWGDPIHIARSMVNTYNPTYFDQYDNCENESEIRLKESNNGDIVVAPNPTTGLISINVHSGSITKIQVLTSNGTVMRSIDNISSNYHHLDLIELNNGMYFLKITKKDGSFYTAKIIILK